MNNFSICDEAKYLEDMITAFSQHTKFLESHCLHAPHCLAARARGWNRFPPAFLHRQALVSHLRHLIPEPHAPGCEIPDTVHPRTGLSLHGFHLCFLIFALLPIHFPTLRVFSLAPSISPHFTHLINSCFRVRSRVIISMKLSPTPTGQNQWPVLPGHLPITSVHVFLSEKL